MRALAFPLFVAVGCASEPPPPRATTPAASVAATPVSTPTAPPAPSVSASESAPSVSASAVASAMPPTDEMSSDVGVGPPSGLGNIPNCYNGWTNTVSAVGIGSLSGGTKVRELRGDLASVTGARSLDDLRASICDAFAGPQKCFLAANPGLGDQPTTAKVAFEVDKSGVVTAAKADKGDADAKLAACLVDAIKATKFQSGKGKSNAIYRFDIPAKVPPVGHISESSPTIGKGLPPEVVRRVVRARFAALRTCYSKSLEKEPNLAGTVSVTFSISKLGALENLKVTAGTLKHADVLACVNKIFGTMKFPQPEGVDTVAVTYPLQFQPGK